MLDKEFEALLHEPIYLEEVGHENGHCILDVQLRATYC